MDGKGHLTEVVQTENDRLTFCMRCGRLLRIAPSSPGSLPMRSTVAESLPCDGGARSA